MKPEESAFTGPAARDAPGEKSQGVEPSLVLLKPGSTGAPIFMAHGLGDTVSGLARLASLLEVSRPIYGMQAKGLDGIHEPLNRIEDMAAFHLEAIRQLQPHGPYFLIGYSLGGLVAVEIARRLSVGGEKIGLLTLVDAYPHRKYASLAPRARVLVRLIKARIAGLLQTNANRHGLKEVKGANPLPAGESAMRRVREGQVLAWKNYRPQPYAGKVKFVKATVSSFLPDDPEGMWGPLVESLEVVTVPGNHLEMLTIHAQDVSQSLSRFIKQAPLPMPGN